MSNIEVIQTIVDDIYQRHKDNTDGEVAQYIPEPLKKVSSILLAIFISLSSSSSSPSCDSASTALESFLEESSVT